jgi:murein DD-endopeptidase MepM/ murein hydrolase activator NlpD
MKRLAVLLAVALAVGAGTARGDNAAPPAAGAVPLPGAGVPNLDGALVLAPTWLEPPAQPVQLSPEELQSVWEAAGAAYGIPWQVLAAINKIESNFGRNMGPSSAGAIGWMQFMPSTWERWGVDANGDGIADPWNAEDAITAAARYLAASGGQTDISRAIYSYNHAQWYVDEVLQLSRLFGAGGVQETFTLDRLQVSLTASRAAVARANTRLVAAEKRARALGHHERALWRRAAGTKVLSDRLDIQRRAVQAGVVRASAQARLAQFRSALDQAQQQLATARDRSAAAAFAPGAGNLLGAPSFDGNYVFPVGGGPSVVSVSHHHHDYPAADIAAPMGSPVYALSDAVVERAWRYPDPRCGIGLTLTTSDGHSWTYCHLSVLDAGVQPGVALAAGQQIGLVGMTGDATGPHLHLQLNPQTVYPQSLPWFQHFANVAFRWQDAQPAGYTTATPQQSSAAPVFAVVPNQQPANDASVVLFTR